VILEARSRGDIMSTSRRYLIIVISLAALFELGSSVPHGLSNGLVAGLSTALFGVVFAVCAWALSRRRARWAAWLAGAFMLVDVGGVPFYSRSGVGDVVVQGLFAVVGIAGLVACWRVLREPATAALIPSPARSAR
jgi:hypothetical protein